MSTGGAPFVISTPPATLVGAGGMFVTPVVPARQFWVFVSAVGQMVNTGDAGNRFLALRIFNAAGVNTMTSFAGSSPIAGETTGYSIAPDAVKSGAQTEDTLRIQHAQFGLESGMHLEVGDTTPTIAGDTHEWHFTFRRYNGVWT